MRKPPAFVENGGILTRPEPVFITQAHAVLPVAFPNYR